MTKNLIIFQIITLNKYIHIILGWREGEKREPPTNFMDKTFNKMKNVSVYKEKKDVFSLDLRSDLFQNDDQGLIDVNSEIFCFIC